MLDILKSFLQRLLGLTGYVFVSKRRFGWDPWQDISALLEAVLNPVIIDAGAHTGETLTMAKRVFPAASIHCFEPDPDSFRDLSRVAANYRDVHLYQVALGDMSGSFDFFRNVESMTSSLLPTAMVAGKTEVGGLMVTRETIAVSVMTLDEFCAEHHIEHIDLLKIDCQGFDLRVLKGAQRMLREYRVALIQCEAIFDPQYTGQGWFHEILGFLTNCDYALCGIYHPARNLRFEMTFADALFKSRFRDACTTG